MGMIDRITGHAPTGPIDTLSRRRAGWTFTATCVDTAKIEAFIRDHYELATEDLCFDGPLP